MSQDSLAHAVTVTEFAALHGVSRALVYRWMANTPNLRPRKIAGLTLLTRADQRRILNRPTKPVGRPKKIC